MEFNTVNNEGALAFTMEDEQTLVSEVLTTMLGQNKFYKSGEQITKSIIDLSKKVSSEFLAKLCIYARNEGKLRSVSHLLICLLANRIDGKPYVRKVGSKIILRADDITEILAMYLDLFGKPIPNSLKKTLNSAMNSFNEYSLAKYNRKGKAVTFKDVLCLCHPKAITPESNELFSKILNDKLAIPYTWETEISAKGNTKEVWESLIESNKVGYMALLRNLKNIIKSKANNIDKVFQKLRDEQQVLNSKQLPFRFYSAYDRLLTEGYDTDNVVSTLETAIRLSVKNLSKISGKTLIAVDTSSSMSTNAISAKSEVKCVDIAKILASISLHLCDDAEVVTFDTALKIIELNDKNGIIENSKSIPFRGGGTRINLPIEYMIDSKKMFDRIIIISDNEMRRVDDVVSGWGFKETRSCQSLFSEYQKKINPNCWLHAIDLQGYGTQQFKGDKINYIAGWNERCLEFISLTEQGQNSLIDAIKNIEI